MTQSKKAERKRRQAPQKWTRRPLNERPQPLDPQAMAKLPVRVRYMFGTELHFVSPTPGAARR